MKGHFDYAIRLNDLTVDDIINHQITDEASHLRGAINIPAKGYIGGENASGVAARLITAYYGRGSKYFRDENMLKRAALALGFTLSMEKDDGTYDLKETNFHDGAQTAFIVTGLAPAALLMENKSLHTPLENEVFRLLLRFVNRAADGMLAGGFHTPNHRWVISSALAMCHKLTGRTDCLERINRFLNEGIDCDEEGEYTERSGGIYNIICDRAFIILAETLGMDDLLGIVSRNLKLVFKYIEPDMTINTVNSTRQDAGTMPDWRIYYGLYLYMALKTGDREFRYTADQMLLQSLSRLSPAGIKAGEGLTPNFEYLPFALINGLDSAEWDEDEVTKPDFNYSKLFDNSGIARHRKDDFTLTIVKNNPDFLHLRFGRHYVSLRLAGTFYAQGQFVAESIIKDGESFIMEYRRRWGYKSPLPERQDTSDWRKMDHSKREDVMMQDFVFVVTATPNENGVRLRVKTQGVESVLVKLEMLMEAGGYYSAGGIYTCAKKGDYILQGAGESEYVYADMSKLKIAGGCMSHTYAERMRGSIYGEDKFFTVGMTMDTPVDKAFELSFIK